MHHMLKGDVNDAITCSGEIYEKLSSNVFIFFKIGNVIFFQLEIVLQRHGRLQEYAQRDASRKILCTSMNHKTS